MFKYAICNEIFLGQPIPQAFDTVARMGYAGIELAPLTLLPDQAYGDVRSIDARRRAQVRRQARDAGLEVVGLHWLFAKTKGFHLTSSDMHCRHRTAEYLVALAELCADLGGSVLVLGSPQHRNLATDVSPADGLRYLGEVLSAVMPACEALSVIVALEPLGPHETNFLNSAAEAVALAEQVASASCRLVLDVKAMSTERKTIPEIIRTNHGWLAHFHANDPNLLGPGMGQVDFAPILAALKQTGYDGWISVEAFRYEPTPEDVARNSIACLRKCEAEK